MCWDTIDTWAIENQSNAAVMMYNMSENDNFLRFINEKYSTSNCYGWATTNRGVNIDRYNYLRVHVKSAYWGYNYGTSYDSQQCWIYLYDANYGEYAAYKFRNLSEQTITFDISKFTGNLRIRFNIAPSSYIDIYSIALSKY